MLKTPLAIELHYAECLHIFERVFCMLGRRNFFYDPYMLNRLRFKRHKCIESRTEFTHSKEHKCIHFSELREKRGHAVTIITFRVSKQKWC